MKDKRTFIYAYMAVVISSVVLLIKALFADMEDIYCINMVIDIICLSLCVLLLVNYTNRHGFDIFDPIYFISIIYLFLYFVAPLHDIAMGNYLWFGYNLFSYGPKASLISFAGYLSFYLVYRSRVIFRKQVVMQSDTTDLTRKQANTTKLIAAYFMYAITFAANVYYLINSGFSNLTYILTLGTFGSGTSSSVASSIGYISMLSYSLPTIVLIIWEYNNDRLMKVILFIPMLLLQVARGYRFFVIQIAITFVTYVFLRKKKRPKLKNILLCLLILFFFVLVMTIFRDAIRKGAGVDFTQVSSERIVEAFDEAFWGDLRIYQNFYGMVRVIPLYYPYVFLRQIFIGTLIMAVPRALWLGKISSYGGEGLRELIGSNIAAGQAYPTIGEYYYAFGVVGVIAFMAIFGAWAKGLNLRYQQDGNPLSIMYFSVMLGCCLQLMIRGYFPSNFWYLLFAVLPIWIVQRIKSQG